MPTAPSRLIADTRLCHCAMYLPRWRYSLGTAASSDLEIPDCAGSALLCHRQVQSQPHIPSGGQDLIRHTTQRQVLVTYAASWLSESPRVRQAWGQIAYVRMYSQTLCICAVPLAFTDYPTYRRDSWPNPGQTRTRVRTRLASETVLCINVPRIAHRDVGNCPTVPPTETCGARLS